MRDLDGLAGSVLAAALNLEAVTRPARIWNHSLDLACFLVSSSTEDA